MWSGGLGLLLGMGPALAGLAWPPMSERAFEPAAVRLGGGLQQGLVPPFALAERQRGHGDLVLGWAPHARVRLDLRWQYLWDTSALGHRFSGPGDLRLGTDVTVYRGPVDLRIGWQAKLPNAEEAQGLGTDETDITVLGAVLAPIGPATASLTGGLGIWGNPLELAGQDDVPLSWLGLGMPAGPVRVDSRVGGAWKTPRNPARFEATLGGESLGTWFGGAEGSAGLTPAAATWAAQAWVGWRQKGAATWHPAVCHEMSPAPPRP